jgi:neutral trehalase
MSIRQGLQPGEIGPAALAHYGKYFDISAAARIDVPRARADQSIIAYREEVAARVLRVPPKPDTPIEVGTPHPVDAPGTRFSQLFPADAAAVEQGWLAVGNPENAIRGFDNEAALILRFGYPPNYTARFALLRSQTPFDGYTLEAFTALPYPKDEVLRHYQGAQEKNLTHWNSGRSYLEGFPVGTPGAHRRIARLPNGKFVWRNWDDSKVDYKTRTGVRLESAAEDLEHAERRIAGLSDEAEKAQAWEHFVLSILAACESMQDMSDYQLGDRVNLVTNRTIDIAPSWLQANMAQKYRMMALTYESTGQMDKAQHCWGRFNEIKDVLKDMWIQIDDTHGWHTDLNIKDGTKTGALNAAQALTLLVPGLVEYNEAIMTANTFRDKLLGNYGLRTSDINGCKEQWSGDRNWPSLAMWAMHGFMQAAVDAKAKGKDPQPFIQLADDIRLSMKEGMQAWFDANGTFVERIWDADPRKVAVGGEYCNDPDPAKAQHGFGMSIGSHRVLTSFDLPRMDVDPRAGSWLKQGFANVMGYVGLRGA